MQSTSQSSKQGDEENPPNPRQVLKMQSTSQSSKQGEEENPPNPRQVLKMQSTSQSSKQGDEENPPNPRQDGTCDGRCNNKSEGQSGNNDGHRFWPNCYATCCDYFKPSLLFFLQVLGFAFITTHRIKEKKQKHAWAVQIMKELVSRASDWQYDAIGNKLHCRDYELHCRDYDPSMDEELHNVGYKENGVEIESPILIAAKLGIKEMVKEILHYFPVAIQDVNGEGKNVMLLAVENRQLSVYKLLKKRNVANQIFQQVDKHGNGILHLAATYKPGLIPGGALQMQSEIKWYQLVKNSSCPMYIRRNKRGQTSKDVFLETHKELVNEGGMWLNSTTQSCSVVSALIAAVAFATATAIPGGLIQDKGIPVFERMSMFKVFAIASLIALCFSVTSLIMFLAMFLAIATSSCNQVDFYTKLTKKLTIGLTSLFISMTSMLMSYFASLSFVLKGQLNKITFLILLASCLPITLYSILPLVPTYAHLIRSSFSKEPLQVYSGKTPLISSIE